VAGDTTAKRSIVVQPRAADGQDAAALQVISETHRSWDPLHYVLMFPYGTDGFHLDIQNNQFNQKCVTAMEYYSYRLMQRGGLSIIHRCGRLFQQYIVDACAKIEQSRLNYIRFNQSSLRSDIYSGVADAVLANDGDRAGHRIVLYQRRSLAQHATCIVCFKTPWLLYADMASHIYLSLSHATLNDQKSSRRYLTARVPVTDLTSSVACFA